MVHFTFQIIDRVIYQRALYFLQTKIASNRGLKISTLSVGA